MSKSIVSEKIGKVLEMATQLNPSSTSRDITGKKPTIFVEFYGHVSLFEVRIHSYGWGDAPYDEPDYSWTLYFGKEKPETIEKQLDEIITTFEELAKRWCEDE